MVEKEHKHLLRDVNVYVEILTQSNFGLSDFFIENTHPPGDRLSRSAH